MNYPTRGGGGGETVQAVKMTYTGNMILYHTKRPASDGKKGDVP